MLKELKDTYTSKEMVILLIPLSLYFCDAFVSMQVWYKYEDNVHIYMLHRH